MNTTARMSLALGLLLAALGGCGGNLKDTKLLIATTERVSLSSTGQQVFGGGTSQSVSADGRFVAFQSTGVNLVPNDTNGKSDIFLRDTIAGTTIRVSVEAVPTGPFPNGPDGTPDADNANGDSTLPSISANGQLVAFVSDAIDLLTDNPKPAGQTDIYVRDLSTGTTRLVSTPPGGGIGVFGNAPSDNPQISPDGRFVVFESVATNLTGDATGGLKHVFVWDANTSLCEMVSKSGGGVVGNGDSDSAGAAQIGSNTAAGLYVVFRSFAGNLVTGVGAPGASHIFRKAIPLGAAEMVDAVNIGLVPSDGFSQTPAITPDGRFVVFRSAGKNLAANDVNNVDDIFLRDMSIATPGLLTLVSLSVDGVQGSGGSILPAISADGRYVAFVSNSANFVSDDTNTVADVFWRDLQGSGASSVRRVSVSTYGQQAKGAVTLRPSITADGRFVAFTYPFNDLVVGDSNGGNDILVNGPLH